MFNVMIRCDEEETHPKLYSQFIVPTELNTVLVAEKNVFKFNTNSDQHNFLFRSNSFHNYLCWIFEVVDSYVEKFRQ